MYRLFSAEVMLETSVLSCRVARGPQPWGLGVLSFRYALQEKTQKTAKEKPQAWRVSSAGFEFLGEV